MTVPFRMYEIPESIPDAWTVQSMGTGNGRYVIRHFVPDAWNKGSVRNVARNIPYRAFFHHAVFESRASLEVLLSRSAILSTSRTSP